MPIGHRMWVLALCVASVSVTAAAQTNYALSFDGSNDYVSVAHNAAQVPSSALTVEAWIRPNGTEVLLMKGNYGWAFGISGACDTDDNKLEYWVDGSCGNNIRSTTTVTMSRWQHVAVVVTLSPSKSLR